MCGCKTVLCNSQAHAAVAGHLSTLFLHCFMSAKPARAAVGRWTGVASVCEWCLGLASFSPIPGSAFFCFGRQECWQVRCISDCGESPSQPMRMPESQYQCHSDLSLVMMKQCSGKFVRSTFAFMFSIDVICMLFEFESGTV